jgi:hypothetical protein
MVISVIIALNSSMLIQALVAISLNAFWVSCVSVVTAIYSMFVVICDFMVELIE